ncbi:MAG: TIR domain-containing protein [Bacteroidota bacterium]
MRFGNIVTFYSYKGGTGRTMSLANIATYFAQKGHKVLAIDWDMEAPGLYQYFKPYCDKEEFNSKEGLIEFMYYARKAHQEEYLKSRKPAPAMVEEPATNYGNSSIVYEESFLKSLFRRSFENYIIEVKDIENLSLVKAGKTFNTDYSDKVQDFDWRAFFQSSPYFFEYFAQYLQTQYDYVFIDSRTGFTDTSGICTTLMPNLLVLVFTTNTQSLEGVLMRARTATDYRYKYDGELRPLYLYPLPSRIEPDEDALRKEWKKKYESAFTDLFKELYDMDDEDLKDSTISSYFNRIQLSHTSKYAYGEKISMIEDEVEDRLSMANTYKVFAELLEKNEPVWDSSYDFSSDSDKSIEVFISYAAKDKLYANMISNTLSEINNKGRKLNIWTDGEIIAGQEWEKVIIDRLKRADIIIFLVSNSFLLSSYISDKEMKVAMERAEKGETVIVPIIIEDSGWAESEIGKLQVIMPNGKPVASHENQTKVYKTIKEQVDRTISLLVKR